MSNGGKICGKEGGKAVQKVRRSLRESQKVSVRAVRFSGKLFGLVILCSVLVEHAKLAGGKVLQRGTVEMVAKATISTDPTVTTTNIIRKLVFNY